MQDDPHGLRQKSERELYDWIGGFKQGHANHIAGMKELKRRSQGPALRRATIALRLAFWTLMVSVPVAARVFGLL